MFGDVAIAVHPDDKRYKDLIGTHVQLPLTDKEIPVIADEYVDPEYGTGAVKITPAHDPNDFEVGKRHNLEPIQVIGFDGLMENVPNDFVGLNVNDARKKVLEALETEVLIRGEEEIEHAVAHCYKCGSIIQPLIKDQWFVDMKPLAKAAIKAIKAGEVTFTPASQRQALLGYLENIRDWNLSRQIPWGIPIPAFQNSENPDDWIFDDRVDETQIVVNDTTYNREEDTFDTWFSSGQWPFIVTDYLDDGPLARFYPTSVLETGGDILYPWVSRMIMLGLKITGHVPFKHVYLHGLVLDEHGLKMSKSKGNVINPLEAVSQYGSDALRLGIMASRSAGQNQAFSTSNVVAGRNFCNKLWNIARYAEHLLDGSGQTDSLAPESLADHWIIRELNSAVKTVDELLEAYRFAEASETVYHTVWSSVADWYIEASKQQPNLPLLAWVLDTTLKLVHPFAPFVTETIWQTLPSHDSLLISQPWPKEITYDEIAAAEFERLQALVTEARFVTSELPRTGKYRMLYGDDALIEDNASLVQQLARLKDIQKADTPKGIRLASSGRDAWIEIDQETLYEHQANLELRLAEARQLKTTLESRLANDSYIEKAPEKLVQESKQSLTDTAALIERLEREFDVLA